MCLTAHTQHRCCSGTHSTCKSRCYSTLLYGTKTIKFAGYFIEDFTKVTEFRIRFAEFDAQAAKRGFDITSYCYFHQFRLLTAIIAAEQVLPRVSSHSTRPLPFKIEEPWQIGLSHTHLKTMGVYHSVSQADLRHTNLAPCRPSS